MQQGPAGGEGGLPKDSKAKVRAVLLVVRGIFVSFETTGVVTWEQLVADNQVYVPQIAQYLIKSFDLSPDYKDELVSSGYLGLVEAAQRFDPSKNTKFFTFAYLRMRGAMIDCLRHGSSIASMKHRSVRAQQQARRRWESREDRLADSFLSQVPDSIESGEMGLEGNPLTVGERNLRLRSTSTKRHHPTPEHTLTNGDIERQLVQLRTEEATPESELANRQQNNILRELLNTLPDLERMVLTEHYLNERSFSEISVLHRHLSRSWLSRLHSRALSRLRHQYTARKIIR